MLSSQKWGHCALPRWRKDQGRNLGGREPGENSILVVHQGDVKTTLVATWIRRWVGCGGEDRAQWKMNGGKDLETMRDGEAINNRRGSRWRNILDRLKSIAASSEDSLRFSKEQRHHSLASETVWSGATLRGSLEASRARDARSPSLSVGSTHHWLTAISQWAGLRNRSVCCSSKQQHLATRHRSCWPSGLCVSIKIMRQQPTAMVAI